MRRGLIWVALAAGCFAPGTAHASLDGADAAARAAAAALPRATAANDADGNGRFDDLDAAYARAGDGARLPVVVTFARGTSTARGLRRVAAAIPGVVVRHRFRVIDGFAGALTDAQAARVAGLPGVRQVELDRAGTRELSTATAIMGADEVVDGLGLDGDGIRIAVLDTGFDVGHQELEGKLVHWEDLGTEREEPYDPDGHGTHVASIALGRGAVPAHRGVAPGAELVGFKIDGGGVTLSNAIRAYERVVELREALGIRIATMSFGFGVATDGTSALELAVDRAWDAGVVCFKSNGNSGPGLRTMTVPAAARGIIAVGNVSDPRGEVGGFALTASSSRGPTTDGRTKPDLVAPGTAITAADAGTTDRYVALTGTSMASPFAAGAAALVLDADPSLTPDEVRAVLIGTAEDRGARGPDPDFGHGRLQVWHAVAEALRRRGASTGASRPPAVPVAQAITATATTGVLEASIDVRDRGFPVALTALTDTLAAGLVVTDPSGATVPLQLDTAPDRQTRAIFTPPAVGRYTVRIATLPGAPVVLDTSHSTAAP